MAGKRSETESGEPSMKAVSDFYYRWATCDHPFGMFDECQMQRELLAIAYPAAPPAPRRK